MASSTPKALPSVVRAIESRVEQLIADHSRLREHNKDLVEQCKALQSTKREMQERIAQLEKQLSVSELRGAMSGSSKNNTRARQYINRLMREVDSCITLLSSPGAE